MVENRKLFYAISLMLLTCCQIITMLPHNVASSESISNTATTITTSTSNSNNSGNNNAEMQKPDKNFNKIKNNNDDDSDGDFLIIAAERKLEKPTIVSSEDVWENQENDSRPADNIDDLIFLDKRPINQQHHLKQLEQQKQEKLLKQHHHHHRPHHGLSTNEQQQFEFHHITMDGGNSNMNTHSDSDEDTDSLTDTTYPSLIVVDEVIDDDADDEEEGATIDGVPHEIELQPDINEEVTPLNVTPLDLSDFLSLIPATKVKTIVNHYYHNDPEVQRAHAFMSSRDFLLLKQHIIAVPEMSAFLRYLNNSGLDLVKFVTALTNLTSYESVNAGSATNLIATTAATSTTKATAETTTTNIAETNDIEYAQKQSNTTISTISNIEMQITTNQSTATTSTASLEYTTTAVADDMETTTAKEQLNGLHGLVDSVLDVLPQDQILATFFDKLEANEQFSKLVDNIGSPEFAKILNGMQNSMPLRNLIFTLHNNGIYVIRIVDSLKSYFFLGGF